MAVKALMRDTAMVGWAFRRAVLAALAAAALVASPRAAEAGDAQGLQIVAATPDGARYAFVSLENGSVKECGLAKAEPEPAPGGSAASLVAATCTEKGGRLLPLEKWTWQRQAPEVAALRPFDEGAAGKTARIVTDEDTHLPRLEILRGSAWVVARPIDVDSVPALSGVLEGPSHTVLRVAFTEPLNTWDELWSVTDLELAGAPARRTAARQDARDATARMRRHRTAGTGVFASAPAGGPKDKWEKRRRHGIAKFVRKWEIAAAYGPLDAAELRDALWLLAWFDSSRRRDEAARWFGGLRARDAPGAAALLADFEKDPDTRGLAASLR
jgi:hypothetical protein